MHRMRILARIGFFSIAALFAAFQQSACADLIRATPGRSFPDIAGDIGGSQTYVFDPSTQTGTFTLSNAPHLMSLGPSGRDLIPLQPNADGTLRQSLRLKLDRNGRLVTSPLNRFEIWGTVTINDRIYHGVLLRGTPTAFGIADKDCPSAGTRDIFGLNMTIESGQLASTFGAEAYLRIVPQANSTFKGAFSCDFSGEKPRTNLLAVDRRSTSAFWELPATIVLILAGASVLAWPIHRLLLCAWRRRSPRYHRPLGGWASTI